jgi:hypothetical protein
MSRKVIGLLASWKCQLEGHNILEVWRMAHLCLMCIWRKWNAKRFEDHEIPMVKLKNIIFKSIYTWTTE